MTKQERDKLNEHRRSWY